MQKIKVLHFAPYFPPHKWGLESHAAEWANAWIRNNYGEVITLTTSIAQPGRRTEWSHTIIPIESFEIVPHFPFPKFWKKEFYSILREVKEAKPDIIVTRTRFFITSFLGWFLAKTLWIPWMHIEHGSGLVESDRWPVIAFSRMWDYTLGWWIIRYSDKVIGISEACKDFIRSFGRKDEVPVIFRGVDFLPTERIEADDESIRLTFIGRLTYLKWCHVLLEALGRIGQKVPWKLTIVGDGEERKKLEEQMRRLDLRGNINFIWMRDREYIATSVLPHTDIFINPSFQEWLPTVVLEALLAKCRVIATDVGGTKEISKEEDLTIIPKDNINVLMLALDEALLDYKDKMWRSYNHVKETFDWDTNIAKYHTITLEVLGNLSKEKVKQPWKKEISL
jgi:glycosyltransferase involved in cell wall biosynthesis